MVAEVQLLSSLVRIPIGQVEPGPNARGEVGDIGELAQSIRALGMQKPLLVHDLGDGRYRVLDGHRRLAALQLLEVPHVDAVVRRAATDAVRIQQQIAIHAQAKSFDPIAEAQALSELMFEHKLTREQIAEAVGRTPLWVRNRIALLELRDDEQRDVRSGRTTISEAQAMISHRRAIAEGRVHARRNAPGQYAASAPQPASATSVVPRHCATCHCREVSGG